MESSITKTLVALLCAWGFYLEFLWHPSGCAEWVREGKRNTCLRWVDGARELEKTWSTWHHFIIFALILLVMWSGKISER